MLSPIKEKRDRLLADYNNVSARINQKQQELVALQQEQGTLQVAVAALNSTIREAEIGLAAAEALCKP